MDACLCGMYVCICMHVICTCVCICECVYVRECMHVYVCTLTHVCKSVEARRGTGSSAVHGLAGGCSELPHVSAETRTWVLYKNSYGLFSASPNSCSLRRVSGSPEKPNFHQ